ncbi:MAG: efflux RND transporter periplasmic adaptor subunit [Sphingomonadales bacterium]|nr:efflux RND transporter periplasmic adaptor subunit [Sphingomonadales bacterium]
MKTLIGLGVLGVALLAAIPAGAQQQQEQPPAKVEVSNATRQLMAPIVRVPGTVVSRNDSRISSEISGRVVWVQEEGANVAEGDPVARLDATQLELELKENWARVKRLEASLRYENQQVGRFEELAEMNHTPQSQLEQAVAQRDMVEQDLAQARVAYERTKENLARTEIRAPFPGRVVARLVQMGEYANVGTELVRLVDTGHVEVRAQVPIGMAPYLADGQSVSLLGGDLELRGPIRTIIPVGDEVTRTMEIRVAMPSRAWVIGSAVQIGLPADAPRQVVAVPRDALILRADATYVFKINGENVAERVAVTTGSAMGALIEVRGSVADGDTVVIRGGERLRSGQSVEIAVSANS